MSLEDAGLVMLLAVPAGAAIACRLRPDWAVGFTGVGLLAGAILLASQPVDHEVGGAGLTLAVSGFGKGALWLSFCGVALAVLAVNPRPGADGASAWSAQLLATLLVAARSPLVLLAVLLLLAVVLPHLNSDRALGLAWSRRLFGGVALVGAALILTRASHVPVSGHAVAVLLVLGLMALLGAMPFGVGLREWLMHARARLAILAATSLLPAMTTALVNLMGALSQLHMAAPAGLAIAAFGALTLLVGALAQLGAAGWRGLAADGVIADLGLVMVGVGALDISGLQGASLALLVMALARPFLYLLEEMAMSGAWAWVGAGAALFTAAGLPPTVGFAARLLVLGSAFHLHPLLAVAVVGGVVVEVFASARLLLRIGIPLTGPGPRTGVAPLASAVALVALVAGLAPGGVLTFVWNLG
jgi:hypothetical protein